VRHQYAHEDGHDLIGHIRSSSRNRQASIIMVSVAAAPGGPAATPAAMDAVLDDVPRIEPSGCAKAVHASMSSMENAPGAYLRMAA
jgi:hypothetical protein